MTAAILTDFRSGRVHWTTRAGYDSNKAIVDYNSYKRYSIDVALPIEFVLPVFGAQRAFVFAPTAGFSQANYDAPNFIVDPMIVRRDQEYRYGAIFDAQLVDNIGLRTQVTYTKIDSNSAELPHQQSVGLDRPDACVSEESMLMVARHCSDTRMQIGGAAVACALPDRRCAGVQRPPRSAQEVGKASAVNPKATANMRTITIGASIAHKERIQTTAAAARCSCCSSTRRR